MSVAVNGSVQFGIILFAMAERANPAVYKEGEGSRQRQNRKHLRSRFRDQRQPSF